MRTKLIVIIAALIAVGTAALAGEHLHAATEAGQVAVPPPAVPVVAGTVLQGDVPIYLRGVGTVIAYNNVIVRSQLTGQIAMDLISQRLGWAGQQPFTAMEQQILALRYGACRALNGPSVRVQFRSCPFLADLVKDYHRSLAGIRPGDDRPQPEELLRAFLYLLGRFQERRKLARAQERREDRQRYADRLPGGPRQPAAFQPDRSLPTPPERAAVNEEIKVLEELLPRLKGRDAKRLRAFLDCQGDRQAAAAKLGLEHQAYSRQLRQTVFPAIRKLARELGLDAFE